jgi:hypothetical protein
VQLLLGDSKIDSFRVLRKLGMLRSPAPVLLTAKTPPHVKVSDAGHCEGEASAGLRQAEGAPWARLRWSCNAARPLSDLSGG